MDRTKRVVILINRENTFDENNKATASVFKTWEIKCICYQVSSRNKICVTIMEQLIVGIAA